MKKANVFTPMGLMVPVIWISTVILIVISVLKMPAVEAEAPVILSGLRLTPPRALPGLAVAIVADGDLNGIQIIVIIVVAEMVVSLMSITVEATIFFSSADLALQVEAEAVAADI